MKILLAALLLLPSWVIAQNYPMDEGFTTTTSGSLPAGWEGDMSVQTYHGLNDGKGLAGLISSTDEEDMVTTPWVGPLDTLTQIIYWYRMVDDFIYPSTEKNITSDKFYLEISTDSINYTPIYTVDSSNHLSTINFKKIDFTLNNYAGQTVKFRFRCVFGAGSGYFVDIDSFKVRKKFVNPLSTGNLANETIRIYPNPVKAGSSMWIEGISQTMLNAEVYNLSGQLQFKTTVNSTHPLPTESLVPGMYVLLLRNEEQVYLHKLTIH